MLTMVYIMHLQLLYDETFCYKNYLPFNPHVRNVRIRLNRFRRKLDLFCNVEYFWTWDISYPNLFERTDARIRSSHYSFEIINYIIDFRKTGNGEGFVICTIAKYC
jgi:hypothetical protein